MYKFTKIVSRSLLFGVLASACLADGAAALDAPKEKPSAQQEQQPKGKDVSVKPELLTEMKKVDQPQSVIDESNNEVITDHIDPKTGEKYQELKAEFIVEFMNQYKTSSNNVVIRVNNYAVKITTIQGLPSHGHISMPFYIKENEFYKYNGLKARLYCRMKDVEIVRKHCRLCASKERMASIDKYCILYGKEEYLFVIE